MPAKFKTESELGVACRSCATRCEVGASDARLARLKIGDWRGGLGCDCGSSKPEEEASHLAQAYARGFVPRAWGLDAATGVFDVPSVSESHGDWRLRASPDTSSSCHEISLFGVAHR